MTPESTKPKFELTTKYGDRYLIHDNGDIERTDLPGFKTSGMWKMLGLVRVTSNHMYIRLLDITKEWLESEPLLYKNGNPKFTVCDFDHGTTRIWGNTKVHGIKSIRFLA